MDHVDSTPGPTARRPAGGIAVVGPCGSGKTTLILGLRQRGYAAREIAQEHSFVPDLWRFATPDVLVYLEASFSTCTQRKRFDWQLEDYEEQVRRLSHAHRHCAICLPTDDLTPEAILETVLQRLSHPA